MGSILMLVKFSQQMRTLFTLSMIAWAFDGHCMVLKAASKNTVLSREQKAKKSIIYF